MTPTPTPSPIGVLVMAYGTAAGPDDIERYYTDSNEQQRVDVVEKARGRC